MSRTYRRWMIAHLALGAGLCLSGFATAQGDTAGSSGTPAVAQPPTPSFQLIAASSPFVSPTPEYPQPAPAPAPVVAAPPAAEPHPAAPRSLPPASQPAWAFSATPAAPQGPATRDQGTPSATDSVREQWMVALSAATHA